ncbi:hypothetical protein Gogos_018322 [Gossypium gossypioides]|uniref:hAT-like transposase RNase-H fold domain-containing protein n=1 Tax=Gossypium gossypioides TaxID=34282 RepID=A0A7J9BDR9_GOSGO|nr:hypothetical protein [Gossypium gossypioides]
MDSDFGVLHSALESRKIFFQLEKIDGNFKLNPSVEEWEMSNYPAVTLMKRIFDYYRSLYNSTFIVATILDLRLKFKFLELSFTEIYGHDSKMHLNKFHKVFTDVYYEYANKARNLFKFASDLDDSNSSTTEIANDCILDSFSKFALASNFNEVASWKSELDCYLDVHLLPLDGAFNILY